MPIIFVLFFLILTNVICEAQGDSTTLSINSVAPSFSVKTIDEKQYSLDSLKGKIVVINFWYVACAPCRKEIPYLNSVVEHFAANQNVIFLAISSWEDTEQLRFFRNRVVFKYELVAKNTSIIRDYQITMFPTNLVINNEGKIAFVEIGTMPDIANMLQSEINKLLALPRLTDTK